MTEPDIPPTQRTAAALALLVLGIVLNMLGVVLVALRGIGWVGFLLMVGGMGMLLLAVLLLGAEARRRQRERPEP